MGTEPDTHVHETRLPRGHHKCVMTTQCIHALEARVQTTLSAKMSSNQHIKNQTLSKPQIDKSENPKTKNHKSKSKKQKTKNRKQKTKNRKQKTKNKKQSNVKS